MHPNVIWPPATSLGSESEMNIVKGIFPRFLFHFKKCIQLAFDVTAAVQNQL